MHYRYIIPYSVGRVKDYLISSHPIEPLTEVVPPTPSIVTAKAIVCVPSASKVRGKRARRFLSPVPDLFPCPAAIKPLSITVPPAIAVVAISVSTPLPVCPACQETAVRVVGAYLNRQRQSFAEAAIVK